MFISLDLETTGFVAGKDQIIEFGAIKFDLNGYRETLQILINPQIPIPQIVTYITKITNEQVKDSPLFQDKMQEIQDFIGDLPIVGHNIQFDTTFLKENGIPLTNDEYDTCQMASILLPGLSSYSLEVISSQLEIEHKEKHRALDDAIAAMELFLNLVKEYEKLPTELHEKIKKLSEKTNWPLKNFLTTLEHKPHQESKKNEPKQETPDNPEKFAAILNPHENLLFETPQPYNELIHTFAKRAHPDSYLALPSHIFREIEKELDDNIAKLDSPKKYISLKRLETFENQEHFEDYEFTSLLKYIIWSKKTKTGLLEEIKLFHHEVKTLPKVCIDETLHPLGEEEFFNKALQKDKSSPAICTHSYIIDTSPQVKDLLILDMDDFTKKLFYQGSYFLNLDIILSQLETIKQIHPSNQSIESLISKSTILFGLIGMLHAKHNDHNHYSPRTTISQIEMHTKEWTDIQEGVKNIITISMELSEINDPKTSTYLQSWKKSLHGLSEIFITPNIEKNQVWIEENMDKDVVIRKSPHTLAEAFAQTLKNCEHYKIIDENIDLNDNASFTKTLYDLPEDLPLIKKTTRKENITIFITEDAPEKDYNRTPVMNFLKSRLKGKTAIIFNSKVQLQNYTLELNDTLTDLNIASQLTGSLGKITEQFTSDPENTVILITAHMWRNFKHHDLVDEIIIHRLPFDPPSDAFISTISQKYQNPFVELQIPRAVFALKSIINYLNTEGEKTVIILDPRIATKKYGEPFMQELENISTPEIVSLSSL
ncbi:hypothetical protein COU74_01175 [Candidatus Peregrinibacteria bacterium CG10_big_fil_rev_8_21_14_0_10_36_19]|nr:MAG: hypothetical protein COU74_01175 [Candidatus Peregrinibacteria bacterium CG10_big_fil_rev_8_21_14_0_10_36_19]